MRKENFIFSDETNIESYSISEGTFEKSDKTIDKINKVILADSILDLKIIKVPVVGKKLLDNLVINTIKKHSTIIPSPSNTDYKILNKEENQYEILTFIKRFEDREELSKKKFFSVYNVVYNLMKNEDFEDNAGFILNIDKTWFLYSFKNRIFKRRDIYFHDDIEDLNKENTYYLNLFSEGDNHLAENFKRVPAESMHQAVLSLKKNIFKNKTTPNTKYAPVALLALLVIILLVYFQMKYNDTKLNQDNLAANKEKLTQIYKKEKAKRGISDELYNEYMKLFSKKSHVNDFFYQLYLTGKNNIELSKLTFENDKFTISGYCRDDSRLEDSFRKSTAWKNVSFSFSKRNNVTSFNIKGEFINE